MVGGLVLRRCLGLAAVGLLMADLCAISRSGGSPPGSVRPPKPTGAVVGARALAARLPLYFSELSPPGGGPERFAASGPGFGLSVTPTEAVVSLAGTTSASDEREQEIRRTYGEAGVRMLRSGRSRGSASRAAADGASSRQIRLRLLGARAGARGSASARLPLRVNDYRGTHPRRWKQGTPTYGRVRYAAVYPGIDLVYHGSQGRLEYDFVVAPGADPTPIQLALESSGGETPRLDARGDLVLSTPAGELRHRKPVAYQEIDGQRVLVPARFRVEEVSSVQCSVLSPTPAPSKGQPNAKGIAPNTQHSTPNTQAIGFELAAYDRTRPLVIDPEVFYSTYFGGSGQDRASAAGADSAGNQYLYGSTDSTDLFTLNPVPGMPKGSADTFLVKFGPNGQPVYATYFGGSGGDYPGGLAFDENGYAYVGVYSFSSNFPTTPGAFQQAAGLGHGYVCKLGPTGTLVYSTAIRGTGIDSVDAITVNSAGEVYATGATSSGDFPVTQGAFQTTYPGAQAFTNVPWVGKLSADGSTRIWATYLGGSAGDQRGQAICLDSAGNVLVAGYTGATNHPTMNAVQANFGGGNVDAFVSKLTPDGSSLVYSTYLGGNFDDLGTAICVDQDGNVAATGITTSTNFPTNHAFQGSLRGQNDAFFTRLTPAGAFIISSYAGGTAGDSGTAVADIGNRVMLVIWTASPDLVQLLGPGKQAGPHAETTSVVTDEFHGGDSDGAVVTLREAVAQANQVDGAGFVGAGGTDIPGRLVVSPFPALTGNGSQFPLTFTTNSTNWPMTPDAFQGTIDPQDSVVLINFDVLATGPCDKPNAPKIKSASLSGNLASLTWEPGETPPPVTNFKVLVEKSANGGFEPLGEDIPFVEGQPQYSAQVDGPPLGQTWTYKVVAQNGCGSTFSNEKTLQGGKSKPIKLEPKKKKVKGGKDANLKLSETKAPTHDQIYECTAELSAPKTGGESAQATVTVPATVTLKAKKKSVSFKVQTTPVTQTETWVIRVRQQGTDRTGSMTLTVTK